MELQWDDQAKEELTRTFEVVRQLEEDAKSAEGKQWLPYQRPGAGSVRRVGEGREGGTRESSAEAGGGVGGGSSDRRDDYQFSQRSIGEGDGGREGSGDTDDAATKRVKPAFDSVKAQQMRKFIAQQKLQAKASPSPLLAEKIKVAERAYGRHSVRTLTAPPMLRPPKVEGEPSSREAYLMRLLDFDGAEELRKFLAEPSERQRYLTMAAEGSPDNLENPENEEEINELLALESVGSPG